MANPQVEDGYTPIANNLLEAIVQAGFNQRALVLILTVARATYGWSQKRTKISRLELFRRARLRPDHGYMTLKDLKDRRILTEDSEGLGVQKDFDLWQRRTRPKSGLDPNQVYPHIGTTTRPKSGLDTRPKSGLLKSRERQSGAGSQAPKSIFKTITKTNRGNEGVKEMKGVGQAQPDHSLNGFISAAVEYLNAKLGTSYKPTTKLTVRCLKGRAEEGFTIEDVKLVIDYKSPEWSDDPKMRQYLRPETLFGPKFESYLQAAKSDPDLEEKP